MLILSRTYHAECAHRLTDGVPEGHPCRRLHGHRYVIIVSVSGPVKVDGMIVEYAKLDAVVQHAVLDKIDHRDLNSVRGADASRLRHNPTVEHLVAWAMARLLRARGLDGLVIDRVRIEEDARSAVEVRA